MSADDITIMSTFDNVKSDHVDMFVEAMVENQRHVRAEAGNLEMRMFQDVEAPGSFFVFGRTAGDAGMTSHLEETEDRGIADQVAVALSEPPVTMNLVETNPAAIYRPTDGSPAQDGLVVVAVFDLKDGYRDRVLAQYEKQVPLVRAFDSEILFNVYAVDGNDNRVIVHERWPTEQAAQDFSSGQPESVATGMLLTEAVFGDLRSAVRTVIELDPY